jgi:hypothetical protein
MAARRALMSNLKKEDGVQGGETPPLHATDAHPARHAMSDERCGG